jgi:putative oxidoreductase
MATASITSVAGSRAQAHVTTADIGIFVLRLALGIIFIAHGGQKLFGWFGGNGLAATVQGFTSGMGIPAPLAYLAIFTEFFGGVAVVIGLLSRLAAAGLAFTMVVAAVKVHMANGFFLATGPGQQNGFEYNLALFAMALAVVLAGPGRIALSDLEAKWFHKRTNE